MLFLIKTCTEAHTFVHEIGFNAVLLSARVNATGVVSNSTGVINHTVETTVP